MRNITYSIIGYSIEYLYKSTKLINSFFRINLFGIGTFSDDKKFDIGGEYDQLIYKKHEIVEIFRAFLKVYQEMLDAVYYQINNIDEFVEPDRWLAIYFTEIVNALKTLQCGGVTTFDIYMNHHLDDDESDKLIFLAQDWWKNVIKQLPPFDFDDFPTLTVNAERKILEYPEKRERLLQYTEHIEKLFFQVCKFEGNLPDILERDINGEFKREIQKHKKKRKKQLLKVNKLHKKTSLPQSFQWNKENPLQFDFGIFGSIRFTEPNSTKLIIFTMIIHANGEKVFEEAIKKKVKEETNSKIEISSNNIRSVITVLNKMIKVKEVSIKSAKKSYFITIST